MKHILDYIIESLSDESIKKLEAILSDKDIDEIIKFLEDNYDKNKKISSLIDKLKSAELEDDNKIKDLNKRKKKDKTLDETEHDLDLSFFSKHGLKDLNWGRNTAARDVFVHLFKDNLDVLEKIVDKNGWMSFEDMPETGNIFELCEGWEDEATTIAFMTNSKSANAGPFEILLKFMLEEGHSGSEGDVSVGREMLEVKAVTYSKTKNGKDLSGGHAAGQKSKYTNGILDIKDADVKIRMTWAPLQIINQYGFEMDQNDARTEAHNKESNYFAKAEAFNKFNERIKEHKLSGDNVAELVLNAILFQYQFASNELDGDNKYKLKPTQMMKTISYSEVLDKFKATGVFTDNGISAQHDFLDAVGSLQLYLYSVIEGFDNLFIGYLDKVEDVSDGKIVNYNGVKSGYYKLFRHLKNDNVLVNFKSTMEHLTFGTLDMANTSQGRTGKIYFKNLKKWHS